MTERLANRPTVRERLQEAYLPLLLIVGELGLAGTAVDMMIASINATNQAVREFPDLASREQTLSMIQDVKVFDENVHRQVTSDIPIVSIPEAERQKTKHSIEFMQQSDAQFKNRMDLRDKIASRSNKRLVVEGASSIFLMVGSTLIDIITRRKKSNKNVYPTPQPTTI